MLSIQVGGTLVAPVKLLSNRHVTRLARLLARPLQPARCWGRSATELPVQSLEQINYVFQHLHRLRPLIPQAGPGFELRLSCY